MSRRPTWRSVYHNVKPPKASGTFTPCTNCKHPRLVSIYILTNPCHRGADKHASMGSVWLRTISLNSGNIPEKQTLQHLPYGERRGTTANHNQHWERERERPVWRQCLLRERDRQPYGHRHYTRHTTFSNKSLGDWPISLPPVLLVAREHNAAASPPVWALLSKTTGQIGRFITPQTVVLPCGNNSSQ